MVTHFLGSADGVVGVEYGHFYVQSRGLAEPPRLALSADDFFFATTDAIAIMAESGETRYVLVQIESWAEEPVTAGPPGADVAERVIAFTDPVVHAQAVMAVAPETASLDLGAPGTYRARAYRWGGHVVEQVVRANADATRHRTESVLLQFWPAPGARPTAAAAPGSTQLDDLNTQLRRWATTAAESRPADTT
ncbi:hypothetical protein GCM10010492_59170 [Saccharothrix mutabilis subsp. mutabilis]|uniref:Uncharacterized protein n=1 Tax=Saccharothrix mutabilis subsp. mutabilis TaxID=66855 RepID=A0ABP3E322_9PSEU